jgi:hypothetical protein
MDGLGQGVLLVRIKLTVHTSKHSAPRPLRLPGDPVCGEVNQIFTSAKSTIKGGI